MSMYSNQKYNKFLGKFSDLAELQSQRPTGEDGEWAVVLDVNKEYYWDISAREWTAGNGSQLATEETLSQLSSNTENRIDSNIDVASDDYYYFLSYLKGTTKWRIERMSKTTYDVDFVEGDSNIANAWADRESKTYSLTI